MSDLARFLPLSQRPRGDESQVTRNWARRQGELLLSVAELLEAPPSPQPTTPGLREGVTVLELARGLAGGARPSRSERAELSGAQLDELTARIRARAVDGLTGRRTVRIRELGDTLADAWELAIALGRPLAVDSTVSAAVALARSLGAPHRIRAVVRGRRLIARDAGWELGSGPAITGSAAAIVLFLYGRGGVPTA